MRLDTVWRTYAMLLNGAWVRVPGAPADLDDRIALGRVRTRIVKDGGRQVMQWRVA